MVPTLTNLAASAPGPVARSFAPRFGGAVLVGREQTSLADLCTNVAIFASTIRRSRSNARTYASASAGDIAATSRFETAHELMFSSSQKGVTE